MKKLALALTVLATLGLAACSSNSADQGNSYKGRILTSAFEGNNLKLTVRKDNCERLSQPAETVEIVTAYNSTLVVGACAKVSDNGQAIKNVSTLTPRSL